MKKNNKWEMICDNNKELLVEYGNFVAEQNNIKLGNNELTIFVNEILVNKEYKDFYKTNKNIFKEVVFDYVCFGELVN